MEWPGAPVESPGRKTGSCSKGKAEEQEPMLDVVKVLARAEGRNLFRRAGVGHSQSATLQIQETRT